MFFGSDYEKGMLQRQRLTGGLGGSEPYNVSAYDGGVAESVELIAVNAQSFSSKYSLTLKMRVLGNSSSTLAFRRALTCSHQQSQGASNVF
jgi:hypothetical protein